MTWELHQCPYCYDLVSVDHEEFCPLNPERNRALDEELAALEAELGPPDTLPINLAAPSVAKQEVPEEEVPEEEFDDTPQPNNNLYGNPYR